MTRPPANGSAIQRRRPARRLARRRRGPNLHHRRGHSCKARRGQLREPSESRHDSLRHRSGEPPGDRRVETAGNLACSQIIERLARYRRMLRLEEPVDREHPAHPTDRRIALGSRDELAATVAGHESREEQRFGPIGQVLTRRHEPRIDDHHHVRALQEEQHDRLRIARAGRYSFGPAPRRSAEAWASYFLKFSRNSVATFFACAS